MRFVGPVLNYFGQAAPVKKEKDLFLAFPAGTFVMDEWKRVYSNEDTEKVSTG